MEIDYTVAPWFHKDEDCIFDGDPYEMRVFTKCSYSCAEYIGPVGCAPTCRCYKLGIPPKIWVEDEACEHYTKQPTKQD